MSKTGDAVVTARDVEQEIIGNQIQEDGPGTTTITATSEPKPDVSNLDSPQLLPKLFDYFHNNREELARAIGVHRSTVDRWFAGKSRPNNSTVLRMRGLMQERGIE